MKYSKNHRLLTADNFRYVFEKPRKIRGEAMDFYIRKNTELESMPRLGIAVPKRIIKHAVMRNRIKRYLREAFRLNNIPLEGYDLIVMIKQGMSSIPSLEYGAVIGSHWNRLLEQCKPTQTK